MGDDELRAELRELVERWRDMGEGDWGDVFDICAEELEQVLED